MKSFVLTAAVAVMGFAGMTTEADADHRRSRRGGFSFQIGGRNFGIAISNGNRFGARRGIIGRPGFFPTRRPFDPGFGVGQPIRPIVVAPTVRYQVLYHMHGTRALQTHCPIAARRLENRLESLGFRARIVQGYGQYDVLYRMNGTSVRTFTCPKAARAFERQVEHLGAHARTVAY